MLPNLTTASRTEVPEVNDGDLKDLQAILKETQALGSPQRIDNVIRDAFGVDKLDLIRQGLLPHLLESMYFREQKTFLEIFEVPVEKIAPEQQVNQNIDSRQREAVKDPDFDEKFKISMQDRRHHVPILQAACELFMVVIEVRVGDRIFNITSSLPTTASRIYKIRLVYDPTTGQWSTRPQDR